LPLTILIGLGQAMTWTVADRTPVFRRVGRSFGGVSVFVALLIFAAASFQPAHAIQIPSDGEQDVLVRTTLMTFNDANMTGNYAVLLAKASRQFQSQITADKLATAFAPFRTNELFFESAVSAHCDPSGKPTIDSVGALVLAGVLKTEEMQVKYRLRFVQNGKEWKLLGINVDAKKL
jgi:hypothetical protein